MPPNIEALHNSTSVHLALGNQQELLELWVAARLVMVTLAGTVPRYKLGRLSLKRILTGSSCIALLIGALVDAATAHLERQSLQLERGN